MKVSYVKSVLLLTSMLLLLTACSAADTTLPSPADDATATTATAADGQLSAMEAEQIALTHAGFAVENVTALRSEYESDGGRHVYEVSFEKGDYDYDYEVDAVTGDVISYDRDTDFLD